MANYSKMPWPQSDSQKLISRYNAARQRESESELAASGSAWNAKRFPRSNEMPSGGKVPSAIGGGVLANTERK
jgi:hypothetical protein